MKQVNAQVIYLENNDLGTFEEEVTSHHSAKTSQQPKRVWFLHWLLLGMRYN